MLLHRSRLRALLRIAMRRSGVSSLLLLFICSAISASCSFVDFGTFSNDDAAFFFSETPSSDLEPVDFNIIDLPPLTEDLFSDSYGTFSNFLASDPSDCSGFLSLGGIRARTDFCSDAQDPSSSEAQPSAENRILSADDLENYWCSGSPRKLGFANIPVCEVALYADDNLAGLATQGGFAEVIFCNLSLLSLISQFLIPIAAMGSEKERN